MISNIIIKLNEGGPFFMYPILFLLILVIILFVKAIISKESSEKTIALIASLGWFTLIWGILGQTLGLISAFDAIQAAGDISPSIMAGGLKVSLLTTLFGAITFLIARIGMIILIWQTKESVNN
ncbi:MAG: MotA/TolQ/ExbB proton channel family protein [Bacteroidales bacterium]|nr:MotA/TolQ/ExbB proton channel family protein [Bacteroidales bacterium]